VHFVALSSLRGGGGGGCGPLGKVEVASEGLSDEDGQDEGALGVEFDRVGVGGDFTPRDSLVGPGASIATIELRGSVDEDREVGSVAHQISIANMMLDDATAENNHAAFLGFEGRVVKQSDILSNIDNKAVLSPRLEVDDVSEGAICEGGAEDGNIVLPAPVVDAIFIIDLLTDFGDDFLGCENGALRLLLIVHLLDQGLEPRLEVLVVDVGHDQVANSVEALLSEVGAAQAEVAHVAVCHALHDVLLNATRRRHDHVHHLVLAQVANVFTHAAASHIGSVAKIDSAAGLLADFGILKLLSLVLGDRLIGEAPLNHLVDLFNGEAQVGGLEASVSVGREHLLVVDALVQVVASDYLSALQVLARHIDILQEAAGHALVVSSVRDRGCCLVLLNHCEVM